MEGKVAKLKRDGMANSRGGFVRFGCDGTSCNGCSTCRAKGHSPMGYNKPQPRAAGWYVTGSGFKGVGGRDLAGRNAPRSFGPFATEGEAKRFGRGAFADDIRTFAV
jgi:hypothetical protein